MKSHWFPWADKYETDPAAKARFFEVSFARQMAEIAAIWEGYMNAYLQELEGEDGGG